MGRASTPPDMFEVTQEDSDSWAGVDVGHGDQQLMLVFTPDGVSLGYGKKMAAEPKMNVMISWQQWREMMEALQMSRPWARRP